MTIKQSTELGPHRQGQLDSLCGIYAILNGMGLAAQHYGKRWSVRPKALFKQSLDFLDEQECKNITRYGLGEDDWLDLARHIFGLVAAKGAADFKRGKRALRDLPDDFDATVAEIENAVTKGTPVAIRVKKPWNHYTVVSYVDGDKWILFDSYGYKSIRRGSVGGEGSGKRFILGRKAIFFLPK